MPLPVASSTEQKVPITVTPETEQGHPATIDGPLRIEVLDGEGTFEYDAEASPLTFFVVSPAGAGTTNYRVSADANMLPGEDQVTLIQDTIEYVVAGANAEKFGLAAGTPVAK